MVRKNYENFLLLLCNKYLELLCENKTSGTIDIYDHKNREERFEKCFEYLQDIYKTYKYTGEIEKKLEKKLKKNNIFVDNIKIDYNNLEFLKTNLYIPNFLPFKLENLKNNYRKGMFEDYLKNLNGDKNKNQAFLNFLKKKYGSYFQLLEKDEILIDEERDRPFNKFITGNNCYYGYHFKENIKKEENYTLGGVLFDITDKLINNWKKMVWCHYSFSNILYAIFGRNTIGFLDDEDLDHEKSNGKEQENFARYINEYNYNKNLLYINKFVKNVNHINITIHKYNETDNECYSCSCPIKIKEDNYDEIGKAIKIFVLALFICGNYINKKNLSEIINPNIRQLEIAEKKMDECLDNLYLFLKKKYNPQIIGNVLYSVKNNDFKLIDNF